MPKLSLAIFNSFPFFCEDWKMGPLIFIFFNKAESMAMRMALTCSFGGGRYKLHCNHYVSPGVYLTLGYQTSSSV